MYKFKVLIITIFALLMFAIPAFAQTPQCVENCTTPQTQAYAQGPGFWNQWNYWYQPYPSKGWNFQSGWRWNTQQSCDTSPNPNSTTAMSPPQPQTKKADLPACTTTDCDCKDFKTRAEAQRVLDAFPGDPFRLDKDKDGIACESLP